ncbi:MAG: hypothetical protein ACI4S2_05850 [Lachnospiraceae bacterium]
MYEGCSASLRMLRMILENGSFDETTHECHVITYNPENECIYLLAEKEDLTIFSLDGIYECILRTEKEKILCKGMIRERYYNKLGKVIVMRVRNGFYKNTVN